MPADTRVTRAIPAACALAAGALLFASCAEPSGVAGPQAADLAVDPTGVALGPGQRVSVGASVRNAIGPVQLAWRSSDTSVAVIVAPATDAAVAIRALRPGESLAIVTARVGQRLLADTVRVSVWVSAGPVLTRTMGSARER